MTTKLDFLAKHPLFKELASDDLEDLAAIVDVLEYQNGAVVAYQQDAADSLVIVKTGRLYAKTVDHGVVTRSRHYMPGDYYGLDWLFLPGANPATVQAKSHDGRLARLIVISSKAFLHYLSTHHDAIDALAPVYDATNNIIAGLPDSIHQQALKIKAKRDRRSNSMNILPDELIELLVRRSGWYLFVNLILPVLGLFFFTFLPFVGLALQAPDTILYQLRFWLPSLTAVVFWIWIGFRFFDWRNDYFIITNRRVIHREFNLRAFRIDIKIARIDQIQSVGTEKPSLMANLLNYGTARITTASQYGVIYFDNINMPQQVTDILQRLMKSVQALDASLEQTLVRHSIEEYFQFEQPYKVVGNDEEEGGPPPPTAVAELTFWQRLQRRYQWRVEEDGVITYHKHFMVALKGMSWPLLFGIILAVITYFTLSFEILTINAVLPIVGILFLFDFAWLIWRMEDWRNDVYQLDHRFIIDIDRTPFGFGETRKQAPLQNIQNVKAYTPNIIHTLLNYGYVEVETAGADSNILFEDVPFPGIVQSDIFQQIEELKQKQREAEEAHRHKSFAVLLDVYKQEEEQGRLPRRTPPRLTAEEWERIVRLEREQAQELPENG